MHEINQNNIVEEFVHDVVHNYPVVKIEDEVLDFELELYDPNTDEVEKRKISDYKGKWLVLFFYPADFTFVCPTELKDLAKVYDEIQKLWNVEVLVGSTDTVFSHKGWIETEPLLKDFKYKMFADRTTALSRYFGILNEDTGNSERGTFIISPEGILKTIEIHTEPVGRSAKELVRKLKALKFVAENPGHACPASWDEDLPVLQPSIKIAGHVGEKYNG